MTSLSAQRAFWMMEAGHVSIHKKIIEVVVEATERDWSKDKLALLKAKAKQLSLFQTEEKVKKEFSVVDKLPYKFFYRFCDEKGREAKLMIEDWEIG